MAIEITLTHRFKRYSPKKIVMRKMQAFFFLLVLIAGFLSVNGQSKIGRLLNTSSESANSPVFIEDISINASTQAAAPVDLYPQIEAGALTSSSFSSGTFISSTSNIESATKVQAKYAMLMDVDIESIKNKLLFGFIEEWYGTNYRYGGTTKKGIDCSAFTAGLLLAVYGFSAPRTAKEQYQNCIRKNRGDLQEGDLVFFNTTGGISHVGVYITNDYFVHSSSSQGVMISSLNDPYFEKRFLGGGKISADTGKK